MHFGISRTPLRKILHRLAGTGYALLENNLRVKVTSMDVSTLRTFFQAAPLIYSTFARLAAENRTSAQDVGLKDTQRRFSQAARG